MDYVNFAFLDVLVCQMPVIYFNITIAVSLKLLPSSPSPPPSPPSLPPSLFRCHHCHDVLAMFEEVASSLEYEGISFGKLEIEANPETKARYQITEVPDVRIFRRGVVFFYQGPGEQEGPKGAVDWKIL